METWVVPEPVLLVTCGVDVQLRYLAVMLAGWTPEAECWVLDYTTVEGDPRDPATLQQFVQSLGETRLPQAGGREVMIHLVGIDSGYATDCVYRAVQQAPRRGARWVYPTKGVGGREGEPIVLPAHDERDARGRKVLRPMLINADGAKDELMACLQLREPGRGYWHLPKRLGADFVKQLTAEERRTKFDRDGVAVGTEWARRGDMRNEALDVAVINLALFHRVRRTDWLALLVARYGRDDGITRYRALYPGDRIYGVDAPAVGRRV